jgi:hypothetical protein
MPRFNSIPTEYNGVLYPSRGEANYAKHLDGLQRAGDIISWQRQVPFTLYTGKEKDSVHVVDFLVTFKGKQEIHEFKKGLITDVYLRKLELFTQCYPYTPYFIAEESRHGYTLSTPQEVLARFDESPKTITPTGKHYSQFEYICSAAIHHLFSLILK